MTPAQWPDAAIHYHPFCLLDVLAEIPLDATEATIWRDLDPSDRRSLRQACQRSRQLCDELVQSATCDIHFTSPPATEGEDEEEVEEQPVPTPDAASFEAWHQAVEVRAAYVARLPRLRSLELNSWSRESHLLAALLHLGAAAGSNVTSLQLCGDNLSLSSGCALRLAFPRLRELELRNKVAADEDDTLDVTGAIFLPLRDLPLTKLVVDNRENGLTLNTMSAEALRSVVHLRHLRHLSLTIHAIGRAQLLALSSVTQLTHLTLRAGMEHTESDGAFTMHDCAGLFTLPHLTFLRLPWFEDSTAPPAAAAPPMGALTRLRCLHFGSHFVMRDAVFAEVCRLTQLTMLRCGRLALACPTPGHLPALQHLRVQDSSRPHALLQTLLPLLPLPSLTALDSNLRHPLCVDLSLADRNGDCGTSAEGQMAALAAVSQHLAAAPHLRLWALTVHQPPFAGLSKAQVAEGLRPLGGQLTKLVCCFREAEDEAGWLALGAALPRLSHLRLDGGPTFTTTGGLAAVCRPFLALERLDCVCSCEEIPGRTKFVAPDALVGLAAARSQPLLVVLYPPPEAGVLAECRAVQELWHGRQNIVWAARARYCCDGSYALL